MFMACRRAGAELREEREWWVEDGNDKADGVMDMWCESVRPMVPTPYTRGNASNFFFFRQNPLRM
jgi:hypothetical protein